MITTQFRKEATRWGGVLCLLLLFAQLALAAPRLSLTYDEPLYIAPGYTVLTTGDFHWHSVIGHGPLLNILTAWPLLLGAHRPEPRHITGWGTEDSLGFSRALLSALGDLATTAWVTRVPMMWLTVLLAASVGRWAKQLWGASAGLLALFLFAFEPNIIAHGQLNTTDIGVTAFGFFGAYLLARYLRSPSRTSYVGAGVALGAAMSSKTSGHFWLGAYGLIVALAWASEAARQRTWRGRLHALGLWSLRLTGWIALGFLTLWATYGFETRPLTARGIPVPIASHWSGLVYQRANVTQGQTTFLAGRLESSGSWRYFPLAFLLKTPLPLIILLFTSVGLAVWRGKVALTKLPLLVPPVAYGGLSLLVKLNIGYRHLLPVLPFLCLWCARLAAPGVLPWKTRRKILLVVPLLTWYFAGSVRMFPHYLTYFNELAGGPTGGYHYLADSSADWGQGFYALRSYLEKEPVGQVYLAAFSSLDPAWYGLDFIPLSPTPGENVPIWPPQRFNPAPGRYVISVTPLQGVWLLDPDTYDWFRHRQPTARVGNSLLIYDVPELFNGRWVAQCAAPLPLLNTEHIAAGFGQTDLRQAVFDCDAAWLYPGDADGWTVLPGDDPDAAWTAKRLAQMPLSFRQDKLWDHPAVMIYEQRGIPDGARPAYTAARSAPTAWALDKVLTEGVLTTAPVRTTGPLTFLGYDRQPTTDGVMLFTYWYVEAQAARPLSLMAHALDPTGQSIAVADGLGVPIETWRPGDIIVQRHHIVLSNPTDDYWLQTGAYWLDTMERWSIMVAGQVIGDRIVLLERPQ